MATAQLIVCATTARTPLFDGRLAPTDCCIVAVPTERPRVFKSTEMSWEDLVIAAAVYRAGTRAEA
ncbi:hypothetical protein [Cryobacterium sp. Y50]|uniref:hypothetical protein n=1 Tax=Cryobacterium sp. Y50 TaxID=2048286 RepID=UPI000CE4EB20|nr:hypothetical protein [Cryobacterium sp. Y50]